MANHRITNLRGDRETSRPSLLFVEQIRQIRRGVHCRAHRRTCEREDAPALLPHVEARQRKAGLRIAESGHEFDRLQNQALVNRANEIEIAIAIVMPCEKPHDERGFVFLNRQLLPPVAQPGIP